MRLHPVILAGGRGERFWPLSRRRRPKQLLPLLSARPMLADTLARLDGAALPSDTFILTARDLAGAVRDAAPSIPHHHVLGEPRGRNTAPAVALAAWWLRNAGDDAIVAVLPSDHRIEPDARFREELLRAGEAALARGAIVTFGIPPTRPETGYGYIEVGDAVAKGSPFHAVAAFREKPDAKTATRYAADGRHLWNAGMFLFPPRVMLEEVEAHAPEIAALLPGLPDRVTSDETALERYYDASPSIAIDVAVMEKSRRALVARAGFAWDDLGSWAALGDADDRDAQGNVVRGRALLLDAEGTIAFDEGAGLIAAVGVKDLVIVRTGDVTLVLPRDRAQDVRAIVERLKREPDGDALL
ncbi:MAG: mannose-1-phosphate guanylyltransferase [Hyphomicrobiales bacterium]